MAKNIFLSAVPRLAVTHNAKQYNIHTLKLHYTVHLQVKRIC